MTDNKNLNVLSISEQNEIGEAVKRMLKAAPFYHDENIQFYDVETGGFGIIPGEGSVYLTQFLSGSFIGRYSFFLRYRVRPGSDSDKVKAQQYLTMMADWLEGQKIEYNGRTYKMEKPELSDNRTVQNIERTSVVGLAAVFDDGDMDFQVSMNFDYLKKKY